MFTLETASQMAGRGRGGERGWCSVGLGTDISSGIGSFPTIGQVGLRKIFRPAVLRSQAR